MTMEWKNVFHKRINELWEKAKDKDYRVTLETYAKRIGTTRSSLRGWLAGKGQPDADGFIRIAMEESVSLAWLLGDKREFSGCTPEEWLLLQKYRAISELHQEDIRVFLDRYYEQDCSNDLVVAEERNHSDS